MVSSSSLRVGTYGRVIRFDTQTDLTPFNTTGGQTLLQVKKPNGSTVAWTATIEQPPTAGILAYTLQEGDLDEVGSYRIHANLILDHPTTPINVYGDLAIITATRLHEQRA